MPRPLPACRPWPHSLPHLSCRLLPLARLPAICSAFCRLPCSQMRGCLLAWAGCAPRCATWPCPAARSGVCVCVSFFRLRSAAPASPAAVAAAAPGKAAHCSCPSGPHTTTVSRVADLRPACTAPVSCCRAIPEGITALSALTALTLDRNFFVVLPPWLAQLRSLQHLR